MLLSYFMCGKNLPVTCFHFSFPDLLLLLSCISLIHKLQTTQNTVVIFVQNSIIISRFFNGGVLYIFLHSYFPELFMPYYRSIFLSGIICLRSSCFISCRAGLLVIHSYSFFAWIYLYVTFILESYLH